ncbi:MAG: transglycosylase domain-containing protein [Candidatus Berkelbacteria bacterium]|nr:transglycosylase domain-containing protein [Candidatus Berkelbacteria bacterium]
MKLGFLNPVNLKQTLRRKNLKKWNKKKIIRVLAYIALGFVFVTALLFAWYAKDLPTPAKIAATQPSQSTKIFDRNGTLLYETGDLKRTLVESNQIPQNIKDATVATEDQSFYQNYGINFKGIARAAFHDIFHIGSGTQGGSTITQQYVKNALLYSNRTISRKIKEVILSIELEFMYSKDQILTMYLNEIPYGGQAAGVEAAAQMYYNKSAKDLDLAQAATLAAIPQAPTYYSPYGLHTDRLIIRRNYVLDQMVGMKYITKDQADAAKKEDATTVGTTVQPRKMSILAPHFSLYVLELADAKFGTEAVEKEGLSIYTTLDYNAQKVAEKAVDDGMAKVQKYGGSNGALVSIDPKAGEVLAMVGSRDFFDTKNQGNFNVATALRQPGSSFKPYVYATAYKQKDFSPSKILYDFTTDFGGGYTPHNYDGKSHGPVTARLALDNSLNIPAVKTTALSGIDNVLTTASDMGISSLTQRSRYGLSLGLGVGEVSLLEHTNGFATFANNGNHHDIETMLKVVDRSNKTIFEYKPDDDKGKQAVDPQIAYELQNIMSDNNSRAMVFGTRTPLYFADRPVGAKTGTTTDFRDAWTLGYTPSLAVGVWVGNDDNHPMSSGADGVVVAAPIFHQFMAAETAGKPVEQFVAPAGIQTVTVEKWSNKLPTQYSKETTTDIFASWQVPTDHDDVNVPVRVCRANGLPAPDNAPNSVTETKVFSIIHSEMPTNPLWEGPVRDWAIGAGLYNPTPTGSCDINNIAPATTIAFNYPGENNTVSGTQTISVTLNNPGNISKVEYSIDGTGIGSSSSSPFSLNYNFDALSTGRHVLGAKATDNYGQTASAEISFFALQNNLSISAVGTSGIGATTATISWTTSTGATGQVFYDTITHGNYNDYVGSSDKNNGLATNHSIAISSLLPNTTYHFRVVSVDNNGSLTSSSDYSFKTGT